MMPKFWKAFRVGNVEVKVWEDEKDIYLELPPRAKVTDVNDLKKALDEAAEYMLTVATTGWCEL